MENTKQIGARIREIREGMGKSIPDFAYMLGVVHVGLLDLEEGRAGADINFLEALYNDGYDANWILFGKGAPKRKADPEPKILDRLLSPRFTDALGKLPEPMRNLFGQVMAEGSVLDFVPNQATSLKGVHWSPESFYLFAKAFQRMTVSLDLLILSAQCLQHPFISREESSDPQLFDEATSASGSPKNP